MRHKPPADDIGGARVDPVPVVDQRNPREVRAIDAPADRRVAAAKLRDQDHERG
jgi:hypothetical protein